MKIDYNSLHYKQWVEKFLKEVGPQNFRSMNPGFLYRKEFKKINKEVYLRAAKRIALYKDYFACHAIENCSETEIEMRLFSKYFKPKRKITSGPWFGYHRDRQNRLARSLALLFIYEIAKEIK